MPRDLIATVDLAPLMAITDRYSVEMKRGHADTFRRALSGMVRRAAAITPPASRSSSAANAADSSARPTLTKQDQERGVTALQRDLLAIFTGIGTSGSRRIRSTSLVQATSIHRRLFAQKIPGRKLRSDRPGGDRYVVPEDVLTALRRTLEKRVGFVAAGWKAGAAKTAVRLPAWVNNKPGRGSASVSTTGWHLSATITNDATTPKLERELTRRLNSAVRLQVAAMEREITAYAAKTARRLGLGS
jgi:hypothetical protein